MGFNSAFKGLITGSWAGSWKQYQIKISKRFTALENLDDNEDINWAWENIQENIKTSAKESLGLYEWRQHKQWFDEERFVIFRSKEAR